MICNAEYIMANPILVRKCLNRPLNHGFCGVLKFVVIGLYWKCHRLMACEWSTPNSEGSDPWKRSPSIAIREVWLKFCASEASFVVGFPCWGSQLYEPHSPPGPPVAVLGALGASSGRSGRASGRRPRSPRSPRSRPAAPTAV